MHQRLAQPGELGHLFPARVGGRNEVDERNFVRFAAAAAVAVVRGMGRAFGIVRGISVGRTASAVRAFGHLLYGQLPAETLPQVRFVLRKYSKVLHGKSEIANIFYAEIVFIDTVNNVQ